MASARLEAIPNSCSTHAYTLRDNGNNVRKHCASIPLDFYGLPLPAGWAQPQVWQQHQQQQLQVLGLLQVQLWGRAASRAGSSSSNKRRTPQKMKRMRCVHVGAKFLQSRVVRLHSRA